MAYSLAQYTGDGVTTTFAVPFPFISRDHVSAKVNGVARSISWINDGLIQLSPAPAAAATIIIARDTSRTTPLVDFQDAQLLTEADLDLANKQNLYVAQEAFDAGTASEIVAQVQADADAAAASATAASNSATAAAASATNSANSATAAATSASDAAASAAAITNVWHLNAANAVTPAQRATIDPNVTYDLAGATLAASFVLSPASSPLAVTAGKTLTTFYASGAYTLAAGSAVAPTNIDISTGAASDPAGSAYGYKSKVTAGANGSVYGVYADVGVDTSVANVNAFPMYLKLRASTASPMNGALMTMEVQDDGFLGNGFELKGSGFTPVIFYPFKINPSVNVAGGAFWWNAPTGNAADFLLYSQVGDADYRFRVDSAGGIHLGQLGVRFQANMSDVSEPNRFAFQSNVAGSTFTALTVLPPDTTGNLAALQLFNSPTAVNCGLADFRIQAGVVKFNSSAVGTGTVLPMAFFVSSEAMRISTALDVGIGSTAPPSFGNGIRALEIAGYTGTASGGVLRMRAVDSSSIMDFGCFSGVGYLQTSTAADLKFGTNNTDRMRLFAGGNFAIGSSVDDGANKLQVTGNVKVTGAFEATTTVKADTKVNAVTGFQFNGTDVVGARVTGWNAPAGTLLRGTYNSGTATAAQTNQTLAALITDLRAHGLIGT